MFLMFRRLFRFDFVIDWGDTMELGTLRAATSNVCKDVGAL